MNLAERVQREMALAHHHGAISATAYALATDVAEKLAYYAPDVERHSMLPTAVLHLARVLDYELQQESK